MRVTYEDEGYTLCIYLTRTGTGSGDVINGEVSVEYDQEQQIIVIRLLESERYKFPDRLKYVHESSHAFYDADTRSIIIPFAEKPEPRKSIRWQADIDLDQTGQIVSLEMLFASPGMREIDDGRDRVYAAGALKHVSKFRVGDDELD